MIRLISIKRPALTALITVLIIGSAALFTSIAIALKGIGETDLSTSATRGVQTDAILLGCSDEALLMLKRASLFAREKTTIAIGNGSCEILATPVRNAPMETVLLDLKARRQRSEKRATLRVVLPTMDIVEWKDVPPSS
jgi:hypothetical protein